MSKLPRDENGDTNGAVCSLQNPGRCIYISNIHWLLPVLVILYFRTYLPAVICDDAFITMKSALNLAEGRGLTFNTDQRIWLVTTPVWAFLLAAGRLVTSDIILSAKSWAVIFEVCFIVSAVHLGRVLSGSRFVGFLLGILLVTNPVYVYTSFSGMEISLSLFVITLTFILLAEKKFTWSLVAASFAVWVRFDNLLVLLITIIAVLILNRKGKDDPVGKLVKPFIAPVMMIGLYFLAGFIYFGDLIPTSVQAKSIHGAQLFTPEWSEGMEIVVREFWKVINGESGRWFVAKTPFWIMVIPTLIGLIRIFRMKKWKAIPLLAFTALYAVAFIGSGNFYAQFFPWYFVPILPGVYLLAVYGLSWIIELVTGLFLRKKTTHQDRTGIFDTANGFAAVVLGIVWIFVMLAPMKLDGEYFQSASDLRERSYAATTVWLGKHLDEGAMIASLEIGAIGFFARPDIRILDLFGILRVKKDRWINAIDLVMRDRPEAVIIIQPFMQPEYMDVESLEKYEMARQFYDWFEYKGLEIGIRADLESPDIGDDMEELEGIYETIDLAREYVWGPE